jgi:molybdate transport system ATP-binding protein
MASELQIQIELERSGFMLQANAMINDGITVITGSSGAGKSTLIGAIAGAVKPDLGRISLNNQVFCDTATGRHLRPSARNIGYVLQDSLLFPHMSVEQNLRYGMRKSAPWSVGHIARILEIDGLLARRPEQLSGGERRRVAIGRALMTNPQLLLLDEPLANLDAARRQAILPLIERLRDEFDMPIIYVTHAWSEIIRLADRLIVMKEGQILDQGTLSNVLAKDGLGMELGLDGSVITATVLGHDVEQGLSTLSSASGQLHIAQIADLAGSAVRVFIGAADVALALSRPVGLSVQNILEATITDIRPDTPPIVNISLALKDGQVLRSRVTPRAVESLGLSVGQTVFALIKSVALDKDLLHHPL